MICGVFFAGGVTQTWAKLGTAFCGMSHANGRFCILFVCLFVCFLFGGGGGGIDVPFTGGRRFAEGFWWSHKVSRKLT